MTMPIDVLTRSFLGFIIALLAGGIAAYPILKGLIALKSRQTIYSYAPESHQKKQGTPTMGGLIVLFGFSAAILATTQDWLLVLWVLGFALIGFSDDFIVPKLIKGKRGLGWKQKFAAEALLAAAATPVFHIGWSPVGTTVLILSVLFFSNAYNFADGLDGLAGSLGVLLALGFSILLVAEGPNGYVAPLAALAGAFIPFLFLNAPPAKVFMGDVGSLPIGAFFGAVAVKLAVQSSSGAELVWRQELIVPIGILSFIMVAELVPVPLQVGYYKLTKKRLFPMTPIHHAFEKKGWPESRVVWSFLLAQFVLVVVATGLAVATKPRSSIEDLGSRRAISRSEQAIPVGQEAGFVRKEGM